MLVLLFLKLKRVGLSGHTTQQIQDQAKERGYNSIISLKKNDLTIFQEDKAPLHAPHSSQQEIYLIFDIS